MIIGCYLCKGHGCDDCFEANCNMMTAIFPKTAKEYYELKKGGKWI